MIGYVFKRSLGIYVFLIGGMLLIRECHLDIIGSSLLFLHLKQAMAIPALPQSFSPSFVDPLGPAAGTPNP